ncbi:hypothetical protein ACH3XW_41820 [Acanthocheilonema viteae]
MINSVLIGFTYNQFVSYAYCHPVPTSVFRYCLQSLVFCGKQLFYVVCLQCATSISQGKELCITHCLFLHSDQVQ